MERDRLRLIVRAALIAALVMGCLSEVVQEASPSVQPSPTSTATRMAPASPSGIATVGPPSTQTPSAIIVPADLPVGGISETRAIEMAREHVRSDARLWATMAGRLIEVNGVLGQPGYNIWEDPLKDRWVWGIQFDSPFEICPPPPGGCLEPRPGLSTVFLDYYTGSQYRTSGYSPGGQLELPYGAVLDAPTLAISNQTDLNVTLVVNDRPVGAFPPGSNVDPIDETILPSAPWHLQALTVTGRVLLSLDVSPDDVWHSDAWLTHGSVSHGAGAPADLSCGRLDIWSGPPLAGPIAPETFPPGDCSP